MIEHSLEDALNAAVNAASPSERERALREHADLLLSDKALEVLEANLTRTNAEGDLEAAALFESLLTAVGHCRRDGLEPGIAEWRREATTGLLRAFIEASSWGERRHLLERFLDDLIGESSHEILEGLTELNSHNADAVNQIRQTQLLLDNVRKHGVEPVFASVLNEMVEQLTSAASEGRREDGDGFVASSLEIVPEDQRPEVYGRLALAILASTDRVGGLAWVARLVKRGVENEAATLAKPRLRTAVGSALIDLAEDGDDQVLDCGIELLETALEEFEAAEGTAVSGLHGLVGLAYVRRRSEDREADLAAARRHLEAEGRATSRDVDAAAWGYNERMLGRVLEMLGENSGALLHFERGVSVPPGGSAEEHLDARMSLARLRMDVQGENRAQEYEAAIAELEAAAAQIEEGTVAWAEIERNLGDAYRKRQTGVPADNATLALRHSERAMSVFTRELFPNEWAQLQHNLGTIFYSSSGGDRADNVEQALACYLRALEVHTREAYPQYFGLTSSAMGMALLGRIVGSRPDNLTEAFHRLEAAATTLDREESKTWWAECRNALGGIYQQILVPDHRENVKRAIDCFEAARDAYVELGNRQRECQSHSNLAAAYIDLGELDGTVYAEALGSAETAIALANRASDPFDWASCQLNLAAALKRTEPDDETATERALGCLKRALEVFTEESHPAKNCLTQSYVGHIHFDRGDWEGALAAYRASMYAGDALLASAYTEAGRREEVRETQLQHVRASYCLLRLGRPDEALVTLESGKARLMEESLVLESADLSGVPQVLSRRLRAARATVGALESDMRSPAARAPDVTAQIGAELQVARAELRDTVSRIRARDPRLFAHDLDAVEILQAAPVGGALVAFVVTAFGTAVFVVESGAEILRDENVLYVPGFTRAVLDELLDERRPESWAALLSGTDVVKTADQFATWRAAISSFVERLWDILLEPVDRRLRELGVERGAPLLLLPQGGLGILPLHASARTENGERRYLIDDYTITYAPSAYWRQACAATAAAGSPDESVVLAVVNPDGDLRFADYEGREIAAMFRHSSILSGDAANRMDVLADAEGADHLHFACHGAYDWDDPARSDLRLRSPENLTLADLLSGDLVLHSTRLVTLSACETGLTDFQTSPDEYLGLPTGFLLAGATGIVSTLWKVEDAATYLLMTEFYREYFARGLADPAAALRSAQGTLRSLTAKHLEERGVAGAEILDYYRALLGDFPPDLHVLDEPYFWAAFTFTGA